MRIILLIWILFLFCEESEGFSDQLSLVKAVLCVVCRLEVTSTNSRGIWI